MLLWKESQTCCDRPKSEGLRWLDCNLSTANPDAGQQGVGDCGVMPKVGSAAQIEEASLSSPWRLLDSGFGIDLCRGRVEAMSCDRGFQGETYLPGGVCTKIWVLNPWLTIR